MRNLKKFLALVMAMVMALSLMVTANAATSNVVYTDSASVTPEFAEAVDVLSGMGVFHGDEEGFRPGSTITRAEVSAIVYRLATGDVNDVRSGLYKTYAPFTDVAETDWFAGYVGYLWNAGYIKGTTATTYNPYDNVTGYEALAMILRAVGYDKNHEFEGGNWIVNVASYATQLGILRDVKTTHFGDTLHLGARRDVVASLLFNTAAYVPQVTYNTLAGGYNQFKNITSETYNDTLGEQLFGLTSDRGIVVGNQATGEKYTKIGFSYVGTRERKVLDGKDTICQFANKPGTEAYIYKTANNDGSTSNATLSFIWDTDLKLFGHQVKVWYDRRTTNNTYETLNYVSRVDLNGDPIAWGGNQFNNVLNTYAMYDEATKTAVVKVPYGDDNIVINDDGDDTLYDKATDKKVGFDVKTTDKTYFNYAFAPTKSADYQAEGELATAGLADEFQSPIWRNNGRDNDGTKADGTGEAFAEDIDEQAPYYLLISNDTTRGNSLDMVVSLDLTVTQISQQNDVWDPYTIGLNVGGNEDSHIYFGGDDGDNERLAITGVTPYGSRVNIAQKNLVLDSAKTLGDNVVAIEITGTTGDKTGGATDGNQKGNAKAVITDKANTSNYYYQTIKLDNTKVGQVVKVDTKTHEVWFADGTKLERSWLADTVADNRVLTLGSDPETNAQENVRRSIEPKSFDEYTFTLDEEGKYIFWSAEKTGDRFVYGTYLDYNTVTASSSFIYPLVGVGLDGKQTQDNITKITNSTEPAPIETGHKLDSETYEASQLPKRDRWNANVGAQVFDGRYIGYTINSKGELKAVLSADNAINTVKQGNTDFFGFNPADVDNDDAAIEIGSDDVKIGAVFAGKNAAGNTSLYLTNNTTFYLVSGAGTDNQKVATYKGLSGLMEGMSKVNIHGEKTVKQMVDDNICESDDVWPLNKVDDLYNYDMIYWTQSSFNYAQDYATTAYQADVVILPLEAVEFEAKTSSNTYFVGDANSTLVDHAREATQFTMYDNKGNEVSMWVEGLDDNDSGNNSADVILHVDDAAGAEEGNFFVKLVATGDKAADGSDIYKVLPVSSSDPTSSLIGDYLQSWTKGTKGVLAQCNDDPTTAGNYTYIATTYSSQLATIGKSRTNIWNVADAKVINLDTKCWPGVTSLTTLNYASSLEQNGSSVGDDRYEDKLQVSCFLSSDNSKQASVIFVNHEEH